MAWLLDRAGHCFTLLILVVTRSLALDTGKTVYWISSAEIYYILSGDLQVRYKVPASSFYLRIELVEMEGHKDQEVAKIDIPRNSTSGMVIFPCGLLDRAGKTAFRLVAVNKKEVLAQTNPIEVRWPKVHVHVPMLVETYSSDVIVQLDIDSLKCKSQKEHGSSMFMDLMYEGPTLSPNGQGGISAWNDPVLMLRKEVKDWLMEPSYDVTLGCDNFDRAGYYKVRLKITSEDTSVITESSTIHVIWSPRYSISIAKPAVEPCDDTLKIIYHYPRCTTSRDKLRIYGRKISNGISTVPTYIFESRVQSGKHFTKVSCSLFQDAMEEYCFSFVSIAKNGAVFELGNHCIPRVAPSVTYYPKWQEWSPWSGCSSTCGEGVHTRYRFCSTSKPNKGCVGKAIDKQRCSRPACPDSSTEKPENILFLTGDCLCGCVVNVTESVLLRFEPNRCKQPFWLLETSPENRIVLLIQEFLMIANEQFLVIRDGSTSLDSILALYSTYNKSQDVQSSSSVLRLEMHSLNASFSGGTSLKIHAKLLEPLKENSTVIIAASLFKIPSFSMVHVAVIMLTVILCTTACFVITALYFRKVKNPDTTSVCSLTQSEYANSPARILGAATSTSELSEFTLVQRRSPNSESLTSPRSPEDYLYNTFLFKSIGSITSPTPSTLIIPKPTKKIVFNPTPTTQELVSPSTKAVSPVSRELESKSPLETPRISLKSVLKHKPLPQRPNLSCSDSPSPIRRRNKHLQKATRQVQRDSKTPLTASLSEISITESEDGFEYDYYDYGCHEVPGSFFCPDPLLIEWPPFIPLPPQESSIEEEGKVPLQDFTYPSPTQSPEKHGKCTST